MRRLPRAEKAKRGTLDNRHKQTNAGQSMTSLPASPKWLSAGAKTVFAEVTQDLYERGLLFVSDLPMIAAYATEMSQFIELTAIINLEGYVYSDSNGQKRKHPALIPQRACYQAILSSAKTLGLSPYFRDKVNGSEPEQEEYDPLAAEIAREMYN